MGRPHKPLCGFGQTILYYDCSDFVDYKATMRNFPNMLNESIEKNYVKNRKTQHKHLNTV